MQEIGVHALLSLGSSLRFCAIRGNSVLGDCMTFFVCLELYIDVL